VIVGSELSENITVPIAWFVSQPFPLERPGESYGDIGRRELERKTESSALQSWKPMGRYCSSTRVEKYNTESKSAGFPASHPLLMPRTVTSASHELQRAQRNFSSSRTLAHWHESTRRKWYPSEMGTVLGRGSSVQQVMVANQ